MKLSKIQSITVIKVTVEKVNSSSILERKQQYTIKGLDQNLELYLLT